MTFFKRASGAMAPLFRPRPRSATAFIMMHFSLPLMYLLTICLDDDTFLVPGQIEGKIDLLYLKQSNMIDSFRLSWFTLFLDPLPETHTKPQK